MRTLKAGGQGFREIVKIENRNEACILIGDLNKHIGCDETGVKGNHQKVSVGGEFIKTLLSSGQYICLNNHKDAIGGPFTRYDPAEPLNKERMSCLDIAIISLNLLPFFQSIEIDSAMKYSPSRAVNKSTTKFSDHFPVIITFDNIPKHKPKKFGPTSHTIWNTKKPDGWKTYETLTEKDDAFQNLISVES